MRALEKGGTVIISPYKGAIVKPLSAAEVLDIAARRPVSSRAFDPENLRTESVHFFNSEAVEGFPEPALLVSS